MRIRKARPDDHSRIKELAEKYDMDYAGMEGDVFWVAEEGERIIGICGLKRHPGGLELCSLSVEANARGRGVGKKLVRTMLRRTPEDVFLATVIPGFFEKTGFSRIPVVPPFMKKGDDWCDGCAKELCTIMARGKR